VLQLSSNTTAFWTVGQEATSHQTIVRIRGEITVFISSAAAALDGFQQYRIGIGMVTQDAFAAAALPTPGGDSDWPGWLWYHSGGALVEFSTIEAGQGMSMARIAIDSKAMRKWRLNETVFGAVTTAGEVGTATLDISASTRMLTKLS